MFFYVTWMFNLGFKVLDVIWMKDFYFAILIFNVYFSILLFEI